MMISTFFVLFLIWTLFPKFSRKLLPLVSSLTYCPIPYLLHSNLPIACSIDHSILLHRLQHWFGLHGTSLDWFSSYLTSRSQAVSIQNSTSSYSNLSCGVPQGFVLGPLLFTLYTTPLGSVISKNSIKYHLYADDTQLYISFTPSNSTSSLVMLSNTFSDTLS